MYGSGAPELVQVGKEIANGGTGCGAMQSAIGVMRNALASGRITADQAYYVIWNLDYLRSLMGMLN